MGLPPTATRVCALAIIVVVVSSGVSAGFDQGAIGYDPAQDPLSWRAFVPIALNSHDGPFVAPPTVAPPTGTASPSQSPTTAVSSTPTASATLTASATATASPTGLGTAPPTATITTTPAAPITISIPAVQDTYVATAVEIPLGQATNLRAGTQNQVEMLTLIEFWLPHLPPRATIDSAELYLFCLGSEGVAAGATGSLEILRVVSPWGEDMVIHKTRPRVSGPKIAWDVAECGTPGGRTVDISDLVRGWHDGRYANFGVEVAARLVPSGRFVFVSSEGWSPSMPEPHLLVSYHAPATPPFTPVPTSGPPVP